MKKLIAIVSMLFLLPLSAMALTVMDDSQMNDITAQAGVSIALDVNLGMHVDTIAWGDSDGTTQSDTDTAGWVGVSDMNADLFVGLRTDIGTGIAPTDLEVLTIDVATDPALYNNSSFVRIGLGTFEIRGDMDMDFELGSDQTLGEELQTLDITGMVVRGGHGGYVDITTDGRDSGVTLNLNVLLDQINMDAMAWGDSDGTDIYSHDDGTGNIVSSTAAGYVGFTNLDINNLNITGKVAIDVATITDYAILLEDPATLAATDYRQYVMYKLCLLKNYAPTQISDTSVILTLGDGSGVVGDSTGDLNITMASMNATSSIGATSDLAGAAEMGQIYIGGANVTVDGMVAIGAH